MALMAGYNEACQWRHYRTCTALSADHAGLCVGGEVQILTLALTFPLWLPVAPRGSLTPLMIIVPKAAPYP